MKYVKYNSDFYKNPFTPNAPIKIIGSEDVREKVYDYILEQYYKHDTIDIILQEIASWENFEVTVVKRFTGWTSGN